jgi:urease accessory protein
MQEINLPGVELLIALSVVGIGVLLAGDWSKLGRGTWAAIFAVAGLFHGYAFGESIVGAEPAPLGAYLVGLALIQSAIAVGTAALTSRQAWTSNALAPRLVGAVVLGVGITALAGQVLPG